jgi:hypothetical protein
MMRNNCQRAWWFGLGLWVLGSLVLADTVCAQNMASFLARRDFRIALRPFAVTVGDFNGDGNLDLATATLDANSVSVLLGQGDGTFTAYRPPEL